MDKTLAIQLQIRQNAEEISSALKGINGWEKAVQKKDKSLLRKAAVPVRTQGTQGTQGTRAGGTVPIRTTPVSNKEEHKDLTPASLVQVQVQKGGAAEEEEVPQAVGVYEHKDQCEACRLQGNAAYASGAFPLAVAHYTSALRHHLTAHPSTSTGGGGQQAVSATAALLLSNRAMAHIQLHHHVDAVRDCTASLSAGDGISGALGVKTLLRRAVAYAALGKVRAALRDLLRVAEAEPNNKQGRRELARVKELLRNIVIRAPMVPVPCAAEGVQENEEGPDPGPQPLPVPETGPLEAEVPEAGHYIPIAIAQEEDEEEEVEVEVVREGGHGGEQSEEEEVPINVLGPAPPCKAPKPSAPRPAAPKAPSGAYELEKALLQSSSLASTQAILESMKPSKPSKRTARPLPLSAMEPSLLHLLCGCVLDVYAADARMRHVWFRELAQLPAFRMLMSLLPKSALLEISERLRAARMEEDVLRAFSV